MEMKDECVALNMPNGISKEINYSQKFVRPSKDEMPKCPNNSAAMKAPSMDETMKGIYRK